MPKSHLRFAWPGWRLGVAVALVVLLFMLEWANVPSRTARYALAQWPNLQEHWLGQALDEVDGVLDSQEYRAPLSPLMVDETSAPQSVRYPDSPLLALAGLMLALFGLMLFGVREWCRRSGTCPLRAYWRKVGL